MEKRIGTITLLVSDRRRAEEVNHLLSEYGDIILCRQGLPLQGEPVSVISLIVLGSVDRINGLCGKSGRIAGVEAKAVATKSGYAVNQ